MLSIGTPEDENIMYNKHVKTNRLNELLKIYFANMYS